MIFANRFEEASFKERIFFRGLNSQFNLFKNDEWIIDETHYTDTTRYDYLLTNRKTNKRYIIEIKIRTENYTDYVYELKKHKSLTDVKNLDPNRNTIIYINSTPDGTLIWNIDKIIDNYKPIIKEMNIATMRSRSAKEDKKTYMLNPKDAKKIEYSYKESDFIKIVNELKQKQIEKSKPKSNGLNFLFE